MICWNQQLSCEKRRQKQESRPSKSSERTGVRTGQRAVHQASARVLVTQLTRRVYCATICVRVLAQRVRPGRVLGGFQLA